MRVDSVLKIGWEELTAVEWRKLLKSLTFVKPNGDVVICYRKRMSKGDYIIPRGAWFLLPDHIVYDDNRTRPKLPTLDFKLTLDAIEIDPRFKGQAQAVKDMLAQEQGLVIRPPGTGKTQIVLAFAAVCQTRVLVLVHTEDILDQWVRYIEKAIPEMKGKVGIIRGKQKKIGQITIATVQTLNRSYLEAGVKWWSQWGALIADEAHHVSAPTWEAVLNNCPAYYRFGFTASPTRADGLHPTMRFLVGPIIHRQKFSSSVALTVKPKRTEFRALYRGPFDWGTLVEKLVTNDERNRQIAIVADHEVKNGNSILILSRRIEHLERIREEMRTDDGQVEILTGSRSKVDRKRILKDFTDGKIRCLLSTQLADEALDVQRLNRICLTFPGKAEGRLIQQVGRAIRQHPEKKDAVIYDFVDHRVGVLRRQWDQRKRIYSKEKISIAKKGILQWR
jgi:superfamily II DNA or RNA helicase